MTFRVSGAERQEALRQALERSGAEAREAKGSGELWRYALDGAAVTLWRTGTCRVQGKGDSVPLLAKLVEEFAVPATGAAAPGEPGARPPEHLPRDRPWAGVDESGKGDFFGPLVSAAVVVAPEGAGELAAVGVQDSKRLSDRRVRALAPQVRELCAHAVTTVAPPRYNDLYEELRSEGKRLNDLLAWAHARSLEDLLAGVPEDRRPAYAIVDQFAREHVVEGRVMAGARASGMRIVQFPRAEADVAVAAASVLAREAFVRWLERASERAGTTLPKGVSPQVVEAARAIVARQGPAALRAFAKLHFATSKRVLS